MLVIAAAVWIALHVGVAGTRPRDRVVRGIGEGPFRGTYRGVVAGSVTLVALVGVLLALNMPDYGRSIVYGLIILGLLLAYGREEEER